MKLSSLALAVASLAAAGAAQAATYNFDGDTTGGPTYNRALAGDPPTGLSAVGTDVAYSTFAFSVDTAGSYDFLSTAAGWDNFTFLYSGSFNPADALSNAIVGNDDLVTIGISGFSTALATGTTYIYVTTGFSNTDQGLFSNSITGPGTVAAVPEPESYALMALGLGAIALGRRYAARKAG
jgi:hypothetical protein